MRHGLCRGALPNATVCDRHAALESKGTVDITGARGVVHLFDCSGGVYAQFAVSQAVAALMMQRTALVSCHSSNVG